MKLISIFDFDFDSNQSNRGAGGRCAVVLATRGNETRHFDLEATSRRSLKRRFNLTLHWNKFYFANSSTALSGCNVRRRLLIFLLLRLELLQLGIEDERVSDGELCVVRPVRHLEDDAGDPALR